MRRGCRAGHVSSNRMRGRQLAAIIAALALSAARGAHAQVADSTPRVDPTWLRSDPHGKVVQFRLTAGLTSDNGYQNFNGFKAGALTLTVPKGWRVVLEFKNADTSAHHSAEVISETSDIPAGPVPPSFPRAFTIRLADGLPPQAVDTVRFVPDKAGSYLIFCAVPGHGTQGAWMRLRVAEKGTEPSVDAAKP